MQLAPWGCAAKDEKRRCEKRAKQKCLRKQIKFAREQGGVALPHTVRA